MNNIQILAINIAKNVFQLQGNDKHGRYSIVYLRKDN
jgi:hypothetical protein